MPDEPNNLERQPRRAEPPVSRDIPIGRSVARPLPPPSAYPNSAAVPGMRGSVAGFYILLLVCCLALIGVGGILLTRQHALQSSAPRAGSPELPPPASDPNDSPVVSAPASPGGPTNAEPPSDTALAPAALPAGKEALAPPLARGSAQVEYPVPPAPTLTPVAPSSPPPDPDAPPSPAPSSPVAAATDTANTNPSSAPAPAVPADPGSPITPNGVMVGGPPSSPGLPAAASSGAPAASGAPTGDTGSAAGATP